MSHHPPYAKCHCLISTLYIMPILSPSPARLVLEDSSKRSFMLLVVVSVCNWGVQSDVIQFNMYLHVLLCASRSLFSPCAYMLYAISIYTLKNYLIQAGKGGLVVLLCKNPFPFGYNPYLILVRVPYGNFYVLFFLLPPES